MGIHVKWLSQRGYRIGCRAVFSMRHDADDD